jgi:protein phosphatase
VTYFVAPHKRGTFVRRENLSACDAAVEAAARGGKKRIARDVTWRAFSTLDADEEAAQLQRRAKLMTSALGARLNRERPDAAALDAYEAEAARMNVEPGYDGPHLSWPLTEEQLMRMVDAFRQGKRLHYKYAAALVGGFRRLASALPTLVYAEVAPATRMTVCGDTHGQLNDLFSIFTLNGVPTPTNRYLMNGDFVDRGEAACEILLTLFGFALLHPGEFGTGRGAAVLLNRGNHESGNQVRIRAAMCFSREVGAVLQRKGWWPIRSMPPSLPNPPPGSLRRRT